MCQVQPAFLRRSLRTIAADLIGRPRNPSVFALIASRRSSGRARVSSGRFCIMWQVASTAQPVYVICSTGWRAPAIPFSEWLASRLTPSVLASLVAFLPLFASTVPETLPQEPLLLSAPHRRHGKICRIRQIAFQKKHKRFVSPQAVSIGATPRLKFHRILFFQLGGFTIGDHRFPAIEFPTHPSELPNFCVALVLNRPSSGLAPPIGQQPTPDGQEHTALPFVVIAPEFDATQFVLQKPITSRANGSVRFRLDQIAHPKQRIASIRLAQFSDGTVCLFLDFTQGRVFLPITANSASKTQKKNVLP